MPLSLPHPRSVIEVHAMLHMTDGSVMRLDLHNSNLWDQSPRNAIPRPASDQLLATLKWIVQCMEHNMKEQVVADSS